MRVSEQACDTGTIEIKMKMKLTDESKNRMGRGVQICF